MIQCPSSSTLFPYTTLFRSILINAAEAAAFQIGQKKRELVLILIAGQRIENVKAGVQRPLHDEVGNLVHGIFLDDGAALDRKSTRLNSSHGYISYAVFCLKK